MPSIRRSKNLKQYAANLLYEVPAGKSASVSVAFVNPKKSTLFVQTAAMNGEFALSAPTAEVVLINNQAPFATDPGLFATARSVIMHASSSTFFDFSAGSSGDIGYRYGYSLPETPAVRKELTTTVANKSLRSLPTLDYLADRTLTNGALFNLITGGYRFERGVDQAVAFSGSAFYTYSGSAGSYVGAGGAIYGQYGFVISPNGSRGGFSNIDYSAVTGQFTSEGSPNCPYAMAQSAGRIIHPGSMQVFFNGGTANVWVSAYSTSGGPAAMFTDATFAQSSAWSHSTAAQSFSGFVNNERLTWCRKDDVSGRYFTGSDLGSIYISPNDNYNTINVKIAAPPADVNVAHPPIRFSATQLAFASLAGTGIYHIMKMGLTPTWTTAPSLEYAANPLLAATFAASGITPIYSQPAGPRPVDLTVWTPTNKYTTLVPFDTRAADVDLVPSLSANAERTNVVLAAGDKLYAYTEAANTIIHVYGYEE